MKAGESGRTNIFAASTWRHNGRPFSAITAALTRSWRLPDMRARWSAASARLVGLSRMVPSSRTARLSDPSTSAPGWRADTFSAFSSASASATSRGRAPAIAVFSAASSAWAGSAAKGTPAAASIAVREAD